MMYARFVPNPNKKKGPVLPVIEEIITETEMNEQEEEQLDEEEE